ncbi:hypothetical protein [Stieleria varia]|nr:hypothetical protein [Stieleria varia]
MAASPTIYGIINLASQFIFFVGLCWGIAYGMMNREKYPQASGRLVLGFAILMIHFLLGAFIFPVIAGFTDRELIPLVFAILGFIRTPIQLLGLGLIATAVYMNRKSAFDADEIPIRPRIIDDQNPYASS